MGHAIANKLTSAAKPYIDRDEPLIVLEWGGGDGRLASAVLNACREHFPQFYSRLKFVSVENSEYHRNIQQQRLNQHEAKIEGLISSSDDRLWRLFRSHPIFLFANELLDAFPVHRLRRIQNQWMEIAVCWNERKNQFQEIFIPPNDPAVQHMIKQLNGNYLEGQTIEMSVQALDWIRSIGKEMKRGFVCLSDYGDSSQQLHASNRMNGTLLCYRNHVAIDDPYLQLGEQDMTAHVNFDWCMEAAQQSGFQRIELSTQKQFLLEQGIMQWLREHDGRDPFSEAARINRSIRQLLLSDGMSELFKILTMHK
jgi:SAM-dependent MidA family methyltransferase